MTEFDDTKLHKMTYIKKCKDKEGYVEATLSGSSTGTLKLCISEDSLKEEVAKYFAQGDR